MEKRIGKNSSIYTRIALAAITGLFIIALAPNALASTAEEPADATADAAKLDTFSIAMNRHRDYLFTFVNESHPYEFGGEYDEALQQDLIYVSDCDGVLTPIEKATNAAFTLLKQHLQELGITIELYSCYRTKEDQQWVYDTFSGLEGWADENKVMEPGYSEHHTGLLLSFVVLLPSDDYHDAMTWTELTAFKRDEHPELEVIYDNLADFGFIERYPDGKEDITGVPSEPYEIRFVGSSRHAHAIMDGGLCLEEYLTSHGE